MELWKHNPLVARRRKPSKDALLLECKYPLIHGANILPYHFIHGFIDFLNQALDLKVYPTRFGGDVYVDEDERARFLGLRKLASGRSIWLLNAGGKTDFTTKWWLPDRYQSVVEQLRDEIFFVQVGAREHVHPELEGVYSLVGKTSLRDLVSLVSVCDGILCPVTMLMHLAAAVPTRTGVLRPCVVIAGGREPAHWEAYPGHQFLHTIGALPCCARGGCWRAKRSVLDVLPGENESENSICEASEQGWPECMRMISVNAVCRAIQHYTKRGY